MNCEASSKARPGPKPTAWESVSRMFKKKKKSNGGEESNASFQNVAEYNAVFSNRKSDGETAFLKISECVCRASLSAVLTQDFIQGKYETEPGVAL